MIVVKYDGNITDDFLDDLLRKIKENPKFEDDKFIFVPITWDVYDTEKEAVIRRLEEQLEELKNE